MELLLYRSPRYVPFLVRSFTTSLKAVQAGQARHDIRGRHAVIPVTSTLAQVPHPSHPSNMPGKNKNKNKSKRQLSAESSMATVPADTTAISSRDPIFGRHLLIGTYRTVDETDLNPRAKATIPRLAVGPGGKSLTAEDLVRWNRLQRLIETRSKEVFSTRGEYFFGLCARDATKADALQSTITQAWITKLQKEDPDLSHLSIGVMTRAEVESARGTMRAVMGEGKVLGLESVLSEAARIAKTTSGKDEDEQAEVFQALLNKMGYTIVVDADTTTNEDEVDETVSQ